MKNKKVTLIPYGFISMGILYFLADYFKNGSIEFKIISILSFISIIVTIIHGFKVCRYVSYKCAYTNWKNLYLINNPQNTKNEDELMSIFSQERKNVKIEKDKINQEKKLEFKHSKEKDIAEKEERKAEMERLRNAGRTVHPSEQTSYQTEPQYDNNVARCPKCGSTSITANKKGFSATKGVLGLAVSPLAGAIAGGAGRNKVMCTCLKCGHQWKAGKK